MKVMARSVEQKVAAEAASDDCEDHAGLQWAVALQYVDCRDYEAGE